MRFYRIEVTLVSGEVWKDEGLKVSVMLDAAEERFGADQIKVIVIDSLYRNLVSGEVTEVGHASMYR